MSDKRAEDEFSAWLAKYEPVERKIIEDRARRLSNRGKSRRKRAKAFGDLCEATEGLAVVWRREGWSLNEMLRWADGDVLTLNALARWLRLDATREIDRIRCRLRRPIYYAREKARRQSLAEERRRIGGRRTTNPCPSKEAILDAWIHRRDSHEAAVRFGSMIHDLECYVDNSLLRDENGAITGRNGGVKAWLYENIPALCLRYTTVMRYKAMAKKLKQIVELPDPVPAEAVLGKMPSDAAQPQSCANDGLARNATGGSNDFDKNVLASGATDDSNGHGKDKPSGYETSVSKGFGSDRLAGSSVSESEGFGKDESADDATGNSNGNRKNGVSDAGAGDGGPSMAFWGGKHVAKAPALEIVRARALWLEVVNGVRASAEALMERIDALVDPGRVEDAAMLSGWKAKYAREITESVKTSWWHRMAKEIAG